MATTSTNPHSALSLSPSASQVNERKKSPKKKMATKKSNKTGAASAWGDGLSGGDPAAVQPDEDTEMQDLFLRM